MFDATIAEKIFQNIDRDFIQPEIARRKTEGEFPEDFKIWECLIRLPKDRPAIVEFNHEFGWQVPPEMVPGAELEMGTPVYAHEIQKVAKVMPPKVDEKRVAFIYLFWSGYFYQILFDFSPNDPNFNPEKDEFELGSVIAEHLQNKMVEIIVQLSRSTQAQLRQIGLWTVTSLLPNPMAKIVERVGSGELEQARAILVGYCNSEFISTRLVETWKPIKVFRERHQLFDDALFLHRNQRYQGSITTLIGQIEGVVADWLHEIFPPTDVKWRIQSRIDQFCDVLKTIPQFEYRYKEALESTIEFLQEGDHAAKPFQEFKNWLDKIDPNFPARHALTHGKYVLDIYTEENSIKLFLLLDTICQFMMFYEARVLGKNLGQNSEDSEET